MISDSSSQKIPCKWMKFNELIKQYDLTEKSLKKLLDTDEINHCEKENHLWVDENSLKLYLDAHQKKTLPREYHQEIIENTKNDIERQLSNYKDYVYLYKSIIEMNFIIKWVIREIPYLIEDDLKYQIFKEVYSGDNIRNIMQRHSISYNSVSAYCNEVKSILSKKSGFLKIYDENFQEKENKLERLTKLIIKYKEILNE